MTTSENNSEGTSIDNPIVLGADSNAPSAPPVRSWSLARRRKFNQTLRRKKWEAHEASREAQQGKENPKNEDLPRVLACPRCGLNIRNVALAIAFGEQKELRLTVEKPQNDS
jgi:hypothetical protein